MPPFGMALALLVVTAVGTAASIISIRHRNLFPESLDWDEKQGRFLISSLGQTSIFALAGGGDSELKFFVDERNASDRYVFLGVKVDAPRNRLLAVVRGIANHSYQALTAFDLANKNRIFSARLDDVVNGLTTKPPLDNDVAVDSQGNAYVTDSNDNFLWKVNQVGQASVFAADPVLTSRPLVVPPADPGADCGLNGIVYHQQYDLLLVGQSNTGSLFKINLRDASIQLVQLPEPLPACDGMALRKDGFLVVVSASKAWLLSSTDHWRTATLEDQVELDPSECFATGLTVLNGFKIYVVCSHLLDYLQGKTRDDFQLQHIEFPKDMHDNPVWLVLVLVLVVLVVIGWRFQMAHFFKEYKRKLY